MLQRRSLFLFTIVILIFSCTATRKARDTNIHSLKFLSEFVIPYNTQFKETKVGGFSGIDYDRKKNVYYVITDDRSDRNPARFYKIKIDISGYKIDSVYLVETIFLKNAKGEFYPKSTEDALHTPDPESIRYNASTRTLVWSSEGERIIRPDKIVLENPAITEIDESGVYIDTFVLPAQLHMNTTGGPRKNEVLEGLAYSNNYQTLYASVEQPLYNDGPRAGLYDSSAIVRIIKFGVPSRRPTAQYGYRVGPVADAPSVPGSFILNGVSEILSPAENQLFVVERSYSTGRGNSIKIFLADLSQATNIAEVSSLENMHSIQLASRKLILNMDELGIYVDNIEGVSFGPRLPNGHRSLVFVSDDNFSPTQKTQFLLFEIE
ncbi:MAG: esterase-like activity of phytase family protein [Ginsengibacter sp.]